MSQQRLVPVLRAGARDQNHRREGAVGFGPGKGARQRVASVRIRVADVFRHVGQWRHRVLGTARVGPLRGSFQVQGQAAAHLRERSLDPDAVARQRALVRGAGHRHRNGDRGAGQGYGLDGHLRIALVHREHPGVQRSFAYAELEAHAQLHCSDVQGSHPTAREVRRVGGSLFVLLGRGRGRTAQRRERHGHADQQGPHWLVALSGTGLAGASVLSTGDPRMDFMPAQGQHAPCRRRLRTRGWSRGPGTPATTASAGEACPAR